MPKREAPTFDAVLSRRVKQVREWHSWSQDELATRMAQVGVRWGRSTVAAIEQGRRRLTASELLMLTVAFGVEVEDFAFGGNLPDDEGERPDWIRIGNVVLSDDALIALLRGKWGEATDGANDPEILLRKRLLALSDEQAYLADVAFVEAGRDAERYAAGVLDYPAEDVAFAAHELWGRGLTEERNRRATTDEGEAYPKQQKGHVSRQMLRELGEYFTKRSLRRLKK